MKKFDGLIWALLFLVFGFFQYNDPDGILWMAIYGIAAVVCYLSYKQRVPRLVLILLAIGYLIGAFYLWPPHYEGLTLQDGYTPSIEEARESLGLAICTLGLVWLFFRTKS